MLEVRGLRKTHGDLVAVHDVSFSVQPGEVFGLLGPNGAGKSTTVAMIAGLVAPVAGEVLIQGATRRRYRSEEATHRSGAAGPRALRRAVGTRQPRLSARCTRSDAAAVTSAIDSALQLVGLERPRARQGGHLQRRHEAPAEPGRQPASRPRHPVAR